MAFNRLANAIAIPFDALSRESRKPNLAGQCALLYFGVRDMFVLLQIPFLSHPFIEYGV